MNKTNENRKPVKRKSEEAKKGQLQKKSKSSRTKSVNVNDKNGVLVDTKRKIESKAKVIGKKTSVVAEKVSDQTTEIAGIAYDKLKKSVSEVYEASSKTMSDMSKKAAKYIKKYEDTIEMKKLNHDRNMKMQELGSHIFNHYKSKSLKLTELLEKDESQKILHELEILNKQIVKLGRKIKKKI
jgi:hypothetical protein